MAELNCMNCRIGDFKHSLCDCDGEFCRTFKGIGNADDFIKKVMTAVQSKTGQWIYSTHSEDVCEEWKCSVCGAFSFEKTNFCHYCGARMEHE